MLRVLVVSQGVVDEEMAGPGIRYYHLARELARSFDVTLAVPNETSIVIEGVRLVRADPASASALTELALGHSAVFAQKLPVATMLRLARSPVRAVYDLYAPVLLESLAGSAQRTPVAAAAIPRSSTLLARYERLVQEVVLATGDSFVCASDRQRDLWLGWLAALGRLDAVEHGRDPTLRSLIDVVPFGIDPDPPHHVRPALRGVLPGVTERSDVLLWGGGIWDWLDPLTVIRAVATLVERREEVRLVFMGGGRPSAGDDEEMAMAARARTLAGELGVLDPAVVFNDRWVPYGERGDWLVEADIGVSAHFADLETRFAFRTRLLDYLWAGLPIVTTRGDVLGDLVETDRIGRTVGVGDVGGWVSALDVLLEDDTARLESAERARSVRERFAWPRVASRLAELLAEPGGRVSSSRSPWLTAAREREIRARLSLEHRGAGIVRHALDRAVGAVRGSGEP